MHFSLWDAVKKLEKQTQLLPKGILYFWISLVAQLLKNLPAVWETWVQSLGWEDPLEKGKATHSSILAWRISWTIQSVQSMGCKESDRTEWLSLHFIRLSYIILKFIYQNSYAAIRIPLCMHACSVMSDSLWPHGLYSPWNSPGQNTGVGSLSLLQGIFPTQGSNPGLWLQSDSLPAELPGKPYNQGLLLLLLLSRFSHVQLCATP